MSIESYRVRYRVDNTISWATVMLHSASESEAIYELKRRGTVGSDKTVIIMEIHKA